MKIGPAIISDGKPWAYHRDVIRRMKPEIVRIRTPKGFGFTPDQLETIIIENPKLRTIVFCTEDGDVTPEQFEAEIIERGFSEFRSYYMEPLNIIFELGNEPNLAGVNIWQHRLDALATLRRFRDGPGLRGIRWSVSLPTTLADTIDLLARDGNGCILDHIDVLTTHLYGWHELGDGAGDGGKWNDILSYLIANTSLPILITEAGIDDKATPRDEKARRYLRWAASAHPRIEGVCLWGVGDWSNGPGRNPSMEIDPAMADVLGSRTLPTPQPEPEPQPQPGSLTIHSPFKTAPSISEGGFVEILARTGSYKSDALWNPTPVVERANEARRIYWLIAAQGHDPARWLAILGKESTFGTNNQSVLVRHATHSWTNARSIRDPSISGARVIHDPIRNSQYVKYASVYDSVQDGLYRVDDPTYAYKDAKSILDVISIWAPESDSNDPVAYAQQMVDWMTGWQQEFPVEQEQPPMPRQLKIALAAGHHNSDGGNQLEYQLVGPICKAYADEFRRRGADVRVITPNDGLGQFNGGLQSVARQVVTWANQGWTADLFLETHTEGAGGRRGVFGIYPDTGDDVDTEARDTLIPLMAKAISQATGLPLRGNGVMSERNTGVGGQGFRLGMFSASTAIKGTTTRLIFEHGAHDAPDDLKIMQAPGFPEKVAKAAVGAIYEFYGLPAEYQDVPQEPEGNIVPEGNPYSKPEAEIGLGGGFKHVWRALGDFAVPILGWPKENERRAQIAGAERTIQLFERCVLAWYPEDTPDGVPADSPFHVRCLTIAEVNELEETGVIAA